jgi:2-phospho-L-lactate guanylyltransferase
LPASGRRVWAAVAAKGEVGGKRRLSDLLNDAERAALSLAMLDDVIDALVQVEEIERVLLVTPDPGLAARYAGDRVQVVADEAGDSGLRTDSLNPAFQMAQRLAEGTATDLLLLPADLPLVGSNDVGALMRAAEDAGVALAPDRADDGTNAMLLRPPSILRPSFGEQSFGRHRHVAEQDRLSVTIVRRPGLALDLDRPTDVAALLATGGDCRARRLLLDLDAGGRLDALLGAQARSATI